MKSLRAVCLLLLVCSCQSTSFHKRPVTRLRGVSETALVRDYGEPESERQLTVVDYAAAPEAWRMPVPQVLSTYPTNVPANLNVRIRRLSWSEGRITTTAWLHRQDDEWVVLCAEEWNMDSVE